MNKDTMLTLPWLLFHCCCCCCCLQYKLKVAPMSRAVAEGRAGNKAQAYGSDSEDDEEGEGEHALLCRRWDQRCSVTVLCVDDAIAKCLFSNGSDSEEGEEGEGEHALLCTRWDHCVQCCMPCVDDAVAKY
jgi:hypothetical protein